MKNKYLKELSRNLLMSKKYKQKIIDEIADEIQRREENSETIEEILTSIGTPEDVAQEFNENIANDFISIKHKIFIYVLSVIGVISLILALHNIISILAPQLSMQYILMSLSDQGNNATFLAFKLSYKTVIIKIIVELLVSFVAFVCIFRLKKRLFIKGGG